MSKKLWIAGAISVPSIFLLIILLPAMILLLLPFPGQSESDNVYCSSSPGVLPISVVPQPLNGYITAAAAQWDADPLALAVLVHNEQGAFDVAMPPPYGNGRVPRTSFEGAHGFMQFLLGTWEGYKYSNPAHQPGDVMDAVDSLYAAAHYLANEGGVVGAPLGSPETVYQEGTLLNAIVAYHSGPAFESVGLGRWGKKYRDDGYEAYLELLRAGGASESSEILCARSLNQDGTFPGILGDDGWSLPVEAGEFRVTSRFGEVSYLRNFFEHTGTDLAGNTGVPITAMRDGVVRYSGYNPDTSYWGYHVIIDHGVINGKHVITRYHVIGRLEPGLQGHTVNADDTIGYLGKTLGNTTGSHVHIEFVVDGVHVNPESFLPELALM